MKPEAEYIQQMADARVAFYREHYRSRDNEWILQELEDWGCEVQIAANHAFEQKHITKDEYQAIVDAARSAWSVARVEIKEYEREEDYLRRLTGRDTY